VWGLGVEHRLHGARRVGLARWRREALFAQGGHRRPFERLPPGEARAQVAFQDRRAGRGADAGGAASVDEATADSVS
jgi:hypothetical protein